MNSKQRKTLEAIFDTPTRRNIEWRQVVSAMTALGAEQIESDGSRVRFILNGRAVTLHRPHPGTELKPYLVRDLREFLRSVGIEP